MNQQIFDAIDTKKIIEFDYKGHHRVGEPHIYGRTSGVEQILLYQTGGSSSSGGLPEWRRFDLVGITGLDVSENEFAGPRPTPSGRHSKWDEIFIIVS